MNKEKPSVSVPRDEEVTIEKGNRSGSETEEEEDYFYGAGAGAKVAGGKGNSGVPSASSAGVEELANVIARATRSEQRRLPQVPLLPLPVGPATPLTPLAMPEDMTILVPREEVLEEAKGTLWGT